MGNITPIIDSIRMIKSDEELQIARHAGEVAMAMMDGAKSVIAHNVPEFEIALAQSEAGTRKAAELLRRENKRYALATQCIGLGMGIATVIESVN